MIRLAMLLSMIAVPAFAQSGWTSNNYGSPYTTYYNGTGANSGWSGTANNYGNPNMTHYNFQGPNGRSLNCTSNNYGGSTTYTDCN